MSGRIKSAREVVSETVDSISPHVERIATDEKLRQRLLAAVAAALVARQRARRQIGSLGVAARLGADPVLRAQALEAISQLQQARRRMQKKNNSHKTRNIVLILTAGGVVVAALPSIRNRVRSALPGGHNGGFPSAGGTVGAAPGNILEEIEVNVPVSTAYNQWTQFEEFPDFMEGVDEVNQLDDALVHWVVTVAGKKAEWDAKITEQEPDRRIAWESIDGKQNAGSVSFEPAGSGSRTRIRLQMSYKPEGVAEAVGSRVGVDERRVRGDLERFRELIERRQHEDGGWRGEIQRGEIQDGEKKAADPGGAASKSPSAGTKPSTR
jgi:uncharacterized membrane protein